MAPCRAQKWGVQSNIWTSSSCIRQEPLPGTEHRVMGSRHPWGFLPAPVARSPEMPRRLPCAPAALWFLLMGTQVPVSLSLCSFAACHTHVCAGMPGSAGPYGFACQSLCPLCPAYVNLHLGAVALTCHVPKALSASPSQCPPTYTLQVLP